MLFERVSVWRTSHLWVLGDDVERVKTLLDQESGAPYPVFDSPEPILPIDLGDLDSMRQRLGSAARLHISRFTASIADGDSLGGDGGLSTEELWADAVRITDFEAGVLYEVEIEGEGDDIRGVGFTCTIADRGDLEGADVMSRAQAVSLAKRFARGEQPAWVPARRPDREPRYRRPELRKVAEVWREGTDLHRQQREAGDRGLSVREYVRQAFAAASVQTVDGWIRAARDAGLIPARTTGRNFKPDANMENPDA